MSEATPPLGVEETAGLFHTPELGVFWRHMVGLCTTGRVPSLAEFDLMAIYELAPSIVILDLAEAGDRLRVRFAGTRVVEMFSRETTGKVMDDIDIGGHKSELLAAYIETLRTEAPHWALAGVNLSEPSHSLGAPPRRFVYERLAFPLRGESGGAEHIAAVLVELAESSDAQRFEQRRVTLPGSSSV